MPVMKIQTLLATASLAALTVSAQPVEVISGLQSPHRIILTPGGNLLVSEPNVAANSGRISLVTRAGSRSSLFESLPSGTEVTLAGGSGPSAMALSGRTLYFALGAGDSERRGPPPTSIHNPAGSSSPLFASILEVRFSSEVDTITAPFRMTAANQIALTDGNTVEMDNGAGARAQVSVLTRFPLSEPQPGVLYRFSNPWGMALTPDGKSLYVNDASMDSTAIVDTATGRWKRIVRYPRTPNPGSVGPPMMDAVPTSVRIYGDQILVSFLSGFPFIPGFARVVALNPGNGTAEPFISGVTSVTDVLFRPRSDGPGEFYVLEFSANQSAAQPPPGRLLKYTSPTPTVAAAPLITPVSLAYDDSTKDLYILELRGRIARLRLE
jgi:hypothetical protein